MYKFELSHNQIEQFENWKKKQQKKVKSESSTIGGRWTFQFSPTGVGILISVLDNETEEEIDLSEYDHF